MLAGIREEPEIEMEEYEEIVGNWDQASVREWATDNRAVSIQEPTSNEQWHTPSDRPWDQQKRVLRIRDFHDYALYKLTFTFTRKRVAYGGRQSQYINSPTSTTT